MRRRADDGRGCWVVLLLLLLLVVVVVVVVLLLLTGVQADGVVLGTITDSSTEVKSITTGADVLAAGVLVAAALACFAAAAPAAVAAGDCAAAAAAAAAEGCCDAPPACKMRISLLIAATVGVLVVAAADRGVPTNLAAEDLLAGSPWTVGAADGDDAAVDLVPVGPPPPPRPIPNRSANENAQVVTKVPASQSLVLISAVFFRLAEGAAGESPLGLIERCFKKTQRRNHW